MTQAHPDYLSYLLRLWRVQEGEKDIWRASLHSPQTGKRVGFASLDELFSFLRKESDTEQDVGKKKKKET